MVLAGISHPERYGVRPFKAWPNAIVTSSFSNCGKWDAHLIINSALLCISNPEIEEDEPLPLTTRFFREESRANIIEHVSYSHFI
jgi:hypothetical protein